MSEDESARRRKSVVVGNRETVQDGLFVKCPGCGEWFGGARGLRSHQSYRFAAMDCRAFPTPGDR